VAKVSGDKSALLHSCKSVRMCNKSMKTLTSKNNAQILCDSRRLCRSQWRPSWIRFYETVSVGNLRTKLKQAQLQFCEYVLKPLALVNQRILSILFGYVDIGLRLWEVILSTVTGYKFVRKFFKKCRMDRKKR
jgi:hypothetical protein